MNVQPCEQGIPGRSADRLRAEAVAVDDSVSGYPVDIRRIDIPVSVRSQAVKPVLIRMDDENVGS